MPLHDHFRGELARRRGWTSFHAAWATYIAEDLNERLPPGYYAGPHARYEVEIDVATWSESGACGGSAGTDWKPTDPQAVAPFIATTDEVEVRVYRNEGGAVLAGAVELVSPANKDRAETREAFVSKCRGYLDQGAGVLVVDIVTERKANLHRMLLERVAPSAVVAQESELYAAGYRPVREGNDTQLAIWYEALALGAGLPTMALWLRGAICVPVRLEETYETTVRRQRIPVNGNQ
jgi:hypothetical protein